MSALVLSVFFSAAQIALLAIVALFLFKLFVWMVSGSLDAPFVPTPGRYAEVVVLTLDLRPGDAVFELGSGDGKFMLAMAAYSPGATFVGIERNPFLYAASLVRKRLAGNPANTSFRRANFFKTDLSQANKIYAYLLDNVMVRLQPKFEREFKGRVASRAFPFSRKELSNVVALTDRIGAHGQHLLFVYDFD